MNRAEARKVQQLEEENARLKQELEHVRKQSIALIHEVTLYRIALIRIDEELGEVKREQGPQLARIAQVIKP